MNIKKHVPNLISQSRIMLGLLFLLLITRNSIIYTAISLLLLCISLVTDYLDGKLARKNRTVSLLGKWIDPISDFIFFFFVYLSFYRLSLMPLLLLILFLTREISMYGIIRPLYMRRKLDPGAKLPGKIKTVLQICGSVIIILLLLANQINLMPFLMIQNISFYILSLLIAASLISLYWYITPVFQSSASERRNAIRARLSSRRRSPSKET